LNQKFAVLGSARGPFVVAEKISAQKHRNAREFTWIHRHLQAFTGIHRDSQVFAGIHRN
jgi:hypothetical protein